ncbi:MAG: hypothetical protein HWE27_18660 [Gammaproteobacteria bacterium]|nr:hypothetical protein [Gammaproteobacteria bacterium]
MKRFWIKLDYSDYESIPIGTRMGIGVTATNLDDAKNQLLEKIFKRKQLPEIKNVVEDIDINELDNNHVRPNMGNPAVYGIWFPLGYN